MCAAWVNAWRIRKVLARLGEIASRQFAWVPSPAVALPPQKNGAIGGLSRAIPVSHAAPKVPKPYP